MKKHIVGFVAVTVIALTAVVGSAANLNWFTAGINEPAGTGSSEGWIIAIYLDGGNGSIDPIAPGGGSLGDDSQHLTSIVPIGWGDLGSQLSWYESVSVPDNSSIFTVVFNSDSLATATDYIVADSALFTDTSANPPPANPRDYDSGSGAGGWQPVPEPTSLALMGLGLVTLVARRFKRK